MEKNNENIFEEFYLSVKMKNKNEYIVYTSEPYKLSEIDIINLIKICLVEERSKIIGRKFLSMYEDSTSDRKNITQERLRKLGLEIKNEQPTTTTRNSKIK